MMRVRKLSRGLSTCGILDNLVSAFLIVRTGSAKANDADDDEEAFALANLCMISFKLLRAYTA